MNTQTDLTLSNLSPITDSHLSMTRSTTHVIKETDTSFQGSSITTILPLDLLYEIGDFLLESSSLEHFNTFFKELATYTFKTQRSLQQNITTLSVLQKLLFSYFSCGQSRITKLAKICAYNFSTLPLAYKMVVDLAYQKTTSCHIPQDAPEDFLDSLCTKFQNLQVVDFLADSLPCNLIPLVKLQKLNRINASFCKAISTSAIIPFIENPKFPAKEWCFFLCDLAPNTTQALQKYAISTNQTATIASGILFITSNKINQEALQEEMTSFLLEDKQHIDNLLRSCSYDVEQLPLAWKLALNLVASKVNELSIYCDNIHNSPPSTQNFKNLINLFPNLTSLTCKRLTLEETHFEALLTKKAQFCSLAFENCLLAAKEPFSYIDQFINLKCLTISFIETKLTDAILTPISKLKALEELDLSGIKNLTDQGITQLKTLLLLRKLDLSSCIKLTPACLQTLSTLPNLTSLNLSNCQNFKNKRIDLLLQLVSLRTLKLNRFDFYNLQDLQIVANMSSLLHVEFGTITKPLSTEMQKIIARMNFLETLIFNTVKLRETELAAIRSSLPDTTVVYKNKTYKEVAESKTYK